MSELPERVTPGASPRKSLLNDPAAEICTQFAMFRHPFFRKLKDLCYLGIPAIFLVSLWLGEPLDRLILTVDLDEVRRREVTLCTQRSELSGEVRNGWKGGSAASNVG